MGFRLGIARGQPPPRANAETGERGVKAYVGYCFGTAPESPTRVMHDLARGGQHALNRAAVRGLLGNRSIYTPEGRRICAKAGKSC